jgi:hypothetical protein
VVCDSFACHLFDAFIVGSAENEASCQYVRSLLTYEAYLCVGWCAFIFRTVAYKDQHANKRTTARRRQESSMHHPERAVQHEHVF